MTLPASKPKPTFVAALILGAALALCGTPSAAGPGPMQVEEPATQAGKPPIQPDQDREGWKSRKNATLTASQKAALQARQETMKDMMALVQQKRRAIREARPEDRQALAQELQKLILEQAQDADRARAAGRKVAEPAAESLPGGSARTQESAHDQKVRGVDRKAERHQQQELHRLQIEEKLKQAEERPGAGNKKDD